VKKTELSEVEQWEIDQEIPVAEPREKAKRISAFLKSKAKLRDDDREMNPELEISSDSNGGLSFVFTTNQERSVEKIVECDLGHKHRHIQTESFSYHSFSISKAEAKALIQWLKARV